MHSIQKTASFISGAATCPALFPSIATSTSTGSKPKPKKHHELGDQELTTLRNAQAEPERERDAKRQIEEKPTPLHPNNKRT